MCKTIFITTSYLMNGYHRVAIDDLCAAITASGRIPVYPTVLLQGIQGRKYDRLTLKLLEACEGFVIVPHSETLEMAAEWGNRGPVLQLRGDCSEWEGLLLHWLIDLPAPVKTNRSVNVGGSVRNSVVITGGGSLIGSPIGSTVKGDIVVRG